MPAHADSQTSQPVRTPAGNARLDRAFAPFDIAVCRAAHAGSRVALLKSLPVFLYVLGGCLKAADFRVENSTVLTSEGAYHWAQSRPAVIPPGKVIVTTQEIEKRGSRRSLRRPTAQRPGARRSASPRSIASASLTASNV